MAQDLMISENGRLVRQDIISQNKGYGNVSERYVPIATKDVLNVMEERAGSLKITGFNNANVRNKDKDGFQRHALMVELENATMIDGTKMNMILFNSNDRSTSLKIFMGSLRAACSNQCVWGDQIAEPVSIRHTQKDWKESIYTLMDAYEETQRKTEKMIEEMMNRHIIYRDIGMTTERVAKELINPNITGELLDPLQLNQAHRKEDTPKTMWHLYQRIQYNMMNGGMKRVINSSNDKGILIDTISNTHKITDTKKEIELNRKLHSIMLDAMVY